MASQIIVQFNRLPDFARSISATPRDIVQKLGFDIEADSKNSMVGGGSPHAPSAPGQPPHVDTGHLKDSIGFEMTGQTSGEVTAGADYSAMLEYGTSRMPARPFLTPAVDRVAGKMAEIGAEIIRKAIP